MEARLILANFADPPSSGDGPQAGEASGGWLLSGGRGYLGNLGKQQEGQDGGGHSGCLGQ